MPWLTGHRFGEYYGDPVAYIATETHSGVISFHVNPPTISATGEPDFLYYVNGNLELLRGEGKVGCQRFAIDNAIGRKAATIRNASHAQQSPKVFKASKPTCSASLAFKPSTQLACAAGALTQV